MKRDMDLVRMILLRVEAAETTGLSVSGLALDDYDSSTVARHIELLDEAGFVEAALLRGGGEIVGAQIQRLTWAGHDFLDAVRDDTTWQKTKQQVATVVGSASLEVIKAVATATTMRALGLG